MVSSLRTVGLCASVATVFPYFNNGLETHPDLFSDSAVELLQMRAAVVKPVERSSFTSGLARDEHLDHAEDDDDGDERDLGSAAWPDWPTPGSLPANVNIRGYSPKRGIKVLEWTNWRYYMGNEYLIPHGLENCLLEDDKPNEPVIKDRDFPIDQYDVLIFSLSNLAFGYPENYVLPRRKLPGQLWIAVCGEPLRSNHDLDCRLANDTTTMELMDAFSSFSPLSDIPIVQDPLVEESLRLPLPDFASHGPEIASLAMVDASNPDRNKFVEGLIAALKERGQDVFSYGGWHKNAEEPVCSEPEEGHVQDLSIGNKQWVNRCAARPFKIVSEQVIEAGYVTEKVWDALGEGSIPVYWGTRDVDLWVPPGSILHAADFDSVAALADRMVQFSAADFAAANAWRSKPTSTWGGWSKAWELSHTTLVPRLCEEAANRFPSPRLEQYPHDAGIPAPGAHELPPSLAFKNH